MKTQLSLKKIFTVRCPTCGAAPGEKCELTSGHRAPIRIVTDAWLQRIPEPTILHA